MGCGIEKTISRTEIMVGINRRRLGANAPIRNAGEDDPSRARRKSVSLVRWTKPRYCSNDPLTTSIG